MTALDQDQCYEAISRRDASHDWRFYTCVTSTGIYCRPVCPARTPRRENCRFVATREEARAAGFRACLRCRPDADSASAVIRGTANTAARAQELIAQGGLDGADIEAMANRLGVGARHLRRVLAKHGAPAPRDLKQQFRLDRAEALLRQTGLSLPDIADEAGFGSLRRFQSAFRTRHGQPPSRWRRMMETKP